MVEARRVQKFLEHPFIYTSRLVSTFDAISHIHKAVPEVAPVNLASAWRPAPRFTGAERRRLAPGAKILGRTAMVLKSLVGVKRLPRSRRPLSQIAQRSRRANRASESCSS